jgi:hypothetical protein
MLTALRLGNFKAFGETQTIPLRPLTLIFGPNSSGKSSIIHGLLFMREALWTHNVDIRSVGIAGDLVDLGGFWQFVHRRDFGRDVECGLDVSSPETGSRAPLFEGVKHVSLRHTIGSPTRRDPYLQTPYAGLCDEIQALHADRLPLFQNVIGSGDVSMLALRLLADHRTVLDLRRHDDGSLRTQLDEGVAEILRRGVEYFAGRASFSADRIPAVDRVIRESLSGLKSFANLGDPSFLARLKEVAEPEAPPPSGRNARERMARVRWAVRKAVSEIALGIEFAVADELARLRYLGPLRSYPPRSTLSLAGNQETGLGSGHEAYGAAREDPKTREAINRWLADEKRLSTPYELVVQNLWTMQEIRDLIGVEKAIVDLVDTGYIKIIGAWKDGVMKLVENSRKGKKPRAAKSRLSRNQGPSAAQALEDTLEHLARRDQEAESSDCRGPHSSLRAMYLLDKRTNTLVTHRDVGLGISQILPVLVNAFGLTNQIIAVEQPEIHLHPALQAELADVFIESALGERKNMFILETHSEHLILRVMRRMRDTVRGQRGEAPPVRPEEVAVLFVEPTSKGSVVHELRLKPDGSLLDPWPGGFFEESFSEIFG